MIQTVHSGKLKWGQMQEATQTFCGREIQESEYVNPYPAGIKSDRPLPSVQSQTSLHICAVWPGSILLTDQLQVLILFSLKMILESSKNGRWIISFKEFRRWRLKGKYLLKFVKPINSFPRHCHNIYELLH